MNGELIVDLFIKPAINVLNAVPDNDAVHFAFDYSDDFTVNLAVSRKAKVEDGFAKLEVSLTNTSPIQNEQY